MNASPDRLMWHMKQSNQRRPCLQWAQANLLHEEQVLRVPLPDHLRGHKRLRGHRVEGPLPPTLAERVAADALGRYAALPPPAQPADMQGSQHQAETLSEEAPVHRCFSKVVQADLEAWCQQCTTFGDWEDPWVEELDEDYRTC